ncbi:M20 metallopeptidase family protein [Kitasatospora camelliae]|uniref:M20/M25/M40 family metallo-hydrolase n=1 Tax=Kitasatospora camelliae TaxID=3156397 RepID=A0AAU8JQ86_9ACTN
MTSPYQPALSRRALLGTAAAASAGVVLAPAGQAFAEGRAAPAGRPGPLDQPAIDEAAARIDAGLIALRRSLHAEPELAGEETCTARAVARRLRAAGLAVTTGVGAIEVDGVRQPGTGVVAVLRGALPGRTVAYRADMDAVPPNGIAPKGGPAAAHVCGHDLHTTVGVGVAQVLARLRHRLRGTVVFFFQPGEEALKGAQAMIDAGVLERYRPEEVHALHCGPFPVGRFAVTPGVGLPGQDQAQITLTGPEAAPQAKELAAAITALGTVPFPDGPDSLERMVTDVQTPGGPLARFLVTAASAGAPGADGSVTVAVKYRCWPEERYVEVREEIRRLAMAYPGARVTFRPEPFPAMVCPEEQADALGRHLRGALGPDAVTVLHAAFPFNGEDFALFLDRIPGTYTFLGVRSPGAGITTAYPHYADFTPDERAIGLGVRAMSGWLAARTGA